MIVLGTAVRLSLAWLIVGWPSLLSGVGVMWIADNVLGYLRHG